MIDDTEYTRRPTCFGRDDGVAMITVIGVLALVTILVFGGFFVSSQALREADLANAEAQAFQAANAGLDAAAARIKAQGYVPSDWTSPLVLSPSETQAGTATVRVTRLSAAEYELESVGYGSDGTTETVKVKMYFIDLYGMNISYGARLDANASNGKINGTTSIYGPLYTYGSLDSENLGNGSGGIKWGPLMVKGGNIVSAGSYIDVGFIYYEPPHTVSVGCTPVPTMIPSVPDFVVPPVDPAYLQASLQRAQTESADLIQGDPNVRQAVNTEVTTQGDTTTYASASGRAAGTVSTYSGYVNAYKVVDNDDLINASGPGLTIDSTTPSFGSPTDDFAWDATTRTLTVWGTVFIDGPFTTGRASDNTGAFGVNYVGNGMIVANGIVSLYGNFVPLHGLADGLGGKLGDTNYQNQTFNPNETIGIVSPDKIICDIGGGNPGNDPNTPPSHAGAFYCVNPNGNDPSLGLIQMGTKTAVVGSVIARGIDFVANNNQHLRTSANLGQCVSHNMPGYGQMVQSFGTWSRR